MKQTKSEFLDPILDTLVASLLGNVLEGKGVVQAVEGTIRPRSVMEPHPLTNFEIQKYEYKSLYVNGDNVTCFDSFGVECISKNKIKKFKGNKNIT